MYQRALDALRGARRDVGIEVRLRGNLALCALRMAEWSLAVVQCDAVLALRPADGKALFRRALALVEMDMFVRALADLRKVRVLCPDDPAVARELARVQMETRRTMRKRRDQFAEVYNFMPLSDLYDNAIPT